METCPSLIHLQPFKNCSSTALPAVGGKHDEEDTQQADLVGGLPSLPNQLSAARAKRKREVLVEQGKFSEALEHHTQYLDMARSLKNAVTEQRALATLGWTSLTMSESEPAKLEKALKYSEKCLKAVLRIPSKDVEKRECM